MNYPKVHAETPGPSRVSTAAQEVVVELRAALILEMRGMVREAIRGALEDLTAERSPERAVARAELLERLGVGRQTLYRWISAGDFPAPNPVSGCWPAGLVDEWIAGRWSPSHEDRARAQEWRRRCRGRKRPGQRV